MPGMILALLTALALGTGPAEAAPARPLRLVTEATAGGVRMRVVGHSPVQCDAIYALEVTNGAAGASNRSVQRGTARLRPGIGATVATLTLATASHEAWTARLKVDPCGSAPTYTEVRSSTR